jgi:glycosyltransferase involved in cell wall biosynthesis
MRILIALTYYRPHISGLTIYVERMAQALAARGHAVTVLTSQFERQLPEREALEGVNIVRVPVAARISKGVVMPTIGLVAWQLVPQHEVFSIHLPQLDAAGFALRGRLLGKPVVVTYHSDLLLPPSLLNAAAGAAIEMNNHLVALQANALVAYTEDFAKHSRLLSRYLHKVHVINPPVEIPQPTEAAVEAFKARQHLEGRGPFIGIAARLAAEKGVEYLLEALPRIAEKYPGATVLHAGPREAIGERAYLDRMEPLLEKYRDRYQWVGSLNAEQLAAFFRCCDVQVVASVNSTETFGLVQVEAALCGTPSVASALPGVRMPTQMTGMGRTFPPRDSAALAEAVLEVLDHRKQYVKPRAPIAEMFSPATVALRYEELFASLLKHVKRDKRSGNHVSRFTDQV